MEQFLPLFKVKPDTKLDKFLIKTLLKQNTNIRDWISLSIIAMKMCFKTQEYQF